MAKRPVPQASAETPVLLYQTEGGVLRLDVLTDGETVWLSQEQMAALFERERSVVTKHIGNVFAEGELAEAGNVQTLHVAHSDKPVRLYSLDVIISVGYRVRSRRGTQFRIWATQRLREYLVKGFALDDHRLKEGNYLDRYFDELVERIRDIRSSERQFYRKVAEIYATSIDYDPAVEVTQQFYATVQNKFHFAITGKTAAELIKARADAVRPNMGLTNWSGERILARDVTVAKNYLDEDEMRALNNIVEQYLAFAEAQALRRKAMRMADWIDKLHGFLSLNEREILRGAGRVSKELANDHAMAQYGAFRQTRVVQAGETDFDESLTQIAQTTLAAPKPRRKKE